MKYLLIFFVCLSLAGCQTPTQQAQRQNAATSAAIERQKKADAAVRGKEADLNRAARYAFVDLQRPDIGARLLDTQLTLTGPAVTAEAILQAQVRELAASNRALRASQSALLADVDQIAAEKKNADLAAEAAIKKTQELTLKLAVAADQKARDDSWGGLYGLVRYLKKSMVTLFWIVVAAVFLVLAVRFASLWLPEAGLILTALEHAVAFIFSLLLKLLPGALKAGGWIVHEAETVFIPPTSTPKESMSDTTTATSPVPHETVVKRVEAFFDEEIDKAKAIFEKVKAELEALVAHKSAAVAAVRATAPSAVPALPAATSTASEPPPVASAVAPAAV
jgi:hypothetical protein